MSKYSRKIRWCNNISINVHLFYLISNVSLSLLSLLVSFSAPGRLPVWISSANAQRENSLVAYHTEGRNFEGFRFTLLLFNHITFVKSTYIITLEYNTYFNSRIVNYNVYDIALAAVPRGPQVPLLSVQPRHNGAARALVLAPGLGRNP